VRKDNNLGKTQIGKDRIGSDVLGFGGAEVGFSEAEQATVTQLLNSALDAGLNLIDTAECYGAS